jgi:hypothetical protein
VLLHGGLSAYQNEGCATFHNDKVKVARLSILGLKTREIKVFTLASVLALRLRSEGDQGDF